MARKSKGFGELLSQQRGEDSLRQRVRSDHQDVKIVSNPQGQVRMSDVLESFIASELAETSTDDERKFLFNFAVCAWNLALMPEEQRQTERDKLVQMLCGKQGEQVVEETTAFLEGLIARKLARFPDNKRFIVDFELRKVGRDYTLNVMSTPEKPQTKS